MRSGIMYLILIIHALTVSGKIFKESPEHIKKRLNFANKVNNYISTPKIEFLYTQEKGIYSIAKENIQARDSVINIPNEYVISSYEMFPFKFEIADLLYHNAEMQINSINSEETPKNKLNNIILALQLMYFTYKDKESIYKSLEKLEKLYYFGEPTKEMLEYLESLPLVLDNGFSFEEEELFLFNTFRYKILNEEYIDNFKTIVNFFKNKRPSIRNAVLPWLNNLEKYKYWLGIINSRCYAFKYSNGKSTLFEEKRRKNQDLLKIFYSEKQYLLKYLDDSKFMLPFLDNINHIFPKTMEYKKTKDYTFVYEFNKEFIIFAINHNFKKNEEYVYSYNIQDNFSFFFSYGYWNRNSIHNEVKLAKIFTNHAFTKNKLEYCVSCKQNDEFALVEIGEISLAHISLKEYNHRFHLFMLFFRLANLNENDLENKETVKALNNFETISSNNEISSYAGFYEMISSRISSIPIKRNGIIHILQKTKNYYAKLENRSDEIEFKYRLRKSIFELFLENEILCYKKLDNILEKFEHFINQEIKQLL